MIWDGKSNGKKEKKKKEKTWTPQNYPDAVPASGTFPRILFLVNKYINTEDRLSAQRFRNAPRRSAILLLLHSL